MKSTSQPNLTPSGVLGTVAKLIRLTEKEDVEWSHWQYPTNNIVARRNLAKYLQMGCPKIKDNSEVATLPEGHELARLILGDDYITPEEMAIAYGKFVYTPKQLEHFADTLPNTKTILWLHANGYMLIAGPPMKLNLFQIRQIDNKLFYNEIKGWWYEEKQKFAHEDKVACSKWLAIRKKAVPNSFSKTWKEQQNLITEVERVPNASEVVYVITAYFKVRGIYLLQWKYVRTSSKNNKHQHILVGLFDGRGVDITMYPEGDSDKVNKVGIISTKNT